MAEKKHKLQLNQSQRQLQILSKYYDIDEEKKEITVSMHYDHADDIIASDVQGKEQPWVTRDFVSRIYQIVDDLPIDYKVNLNVNIDDYDGIDPKVLGNSINDGVELNHYRSNKDIRKKRMTATVLMVTGVLVLFFMGIGTLNSWFGAGETESLVQEVLDIIGWVFVWEATSILFLEPSDSKKTDLLLQTRIRQIALYNYEKDLVFKEDRDTILDSWIDASRSQKTGSVLLLISGGLTLAYAAAYLISSITNLVNNVSSGEVEGGGVITLLVIFYLSFTIILTVQGFAAFSVYAQHGKLQKLAGPFAIISSVLAIIEIIYHAVDHDFTGLMNIIPIATMIMYAAGYLMVYVGKKRSSRPSEIEDIDLDDINKIN